VAVPVLMPDESTRLPPFLFVAPDVAPLACIVRLLPTVFDVGLRSIQIVCAAEPESDNRFVGDVVPMPTLPLAMLSVLVPITVLPVLW
jgi:hypothetical protein